MENTRWREIERERFSVCEGERMRTEREKKQSKRIFQERGCEGERERKRERGERERDRKRVVLYKIASIL